MDNNELLISGWEKIIDYCEKKIQAGKDKSKYIKTKNKAVSKIKTLSQ